MQTRSRLRPAWISTAFLFGLWFTSPLAAQGAPALHWTRAADAASCIDSARLAERVEQLTGPVLGRPASATRSIEGHIEHRAQNGYRARLTLSERDGAPAGERVIEHASEDWRALASDETGVVAITELASLQPAWSQPVDCGGVPLLGGKGSTVWLFCLTDKGVRARQFDADGHVREIELGKPKGVVTPSPAARPATLLAKTYTPDGPLLGVEWANTCPHDDGSICSYREIVQIGEDPTGHPSRLALGDEPPDTTRASTMPVLPTDDGGYFLLGQDGFLSSVARIDAHGENVARNARRRAHTRRETLEPEPAEPSVPEAAFEQAARRELLELAERALREMAEEKREVFALYELEGLSMAEVAASLGVPESTALSRLYAAREEIQRFVRAQQSSAQRRAYAERRAR